MIELLLNLLVPLGILLFAYMIGKYTEQRHFANIRQREALTVHRPAITSREWDTSREVAEAILATGSVVVSIDYFKRFIAQLINLVGGRVRTYESLLDRARREAILRMKESCPQADIFVNLRLETSMIVNTTSNRQSLGGVEIVAYGTAIRYRS